MSLMAVFGFRSKILSFIEVIFFFALSYLFLLGLSAVYGGAAGRAGEVVRHYAWYDLLAWLRILPAWMYVVEAVGYLGLITIYWSPGDEAQNRNEVLAFALFLLALLAIGGWYVNRWWAANV